MRKSILLPALFAVACAHPGTVTSNAPGETEILWDTYGVPHIFAKNRNELARAFGWAQMQNHRELLLRLVAQSRGQGSQFYGREYLEEDRWLHTLDLRGLAARHLAAQPADMREHLAAFTAGINAYAAAHPEQIGDSLRTIFPVEPIDVLANQNRVAYARFLSGSQRVCAETNAWQNRGSNAWAVAPKRSASGHTLLLQNPHLPWSDVFTWIEAQYVAPGINVSGAALVLSPVLQIAFNDNLGWTHTVNTQDAEDLYELTLSGDGYVYDGVVTPFQTSTHVVHVKQPDRSFRDDTVRVRQSVFGPVIAMKTGKAVAVSLVGIHGTETPYSFVQWWNMGRANSFDEFMTAIHPNQISGQNITYGDRAGHIMMFYGGNTPVRPGPHSDRAFWEGIVPGESKSTMWTSLHAFEDMPKTLDPPSGWVQNANDPPWWATFPSVIRASDYPPYIATRAMQLRPQRSARIIDADTSITWDEFLQYKNSTRMELADRVLDDLLPVARRSASASAKSAAAILDSWDRSADSASQGAVLFTEWWNEYSRRVRGRSPFAVAWSENAPRTTPDGLSDTTAAVSALGAVSDSLAILYRSAGVKWGRVYRLRRDGLDLPSNGAGGEWGVFRVINYARNSSDGTYSAIGGTSYVAAIEFSDPVRAVSLIGYGNASTTGSPHRKDQLELFARMEFKTVYRSPSEIEQHLERREKLP